MRRLKLHLLLPVMALACLLAGLSGCASKPADAPIRDLTELPQDAATYHGLDPQERLITEATQAAAWEQFLAKHFDPWERTAPAHTAEEAFWALDRYAEKALFGENTLKRGPEWMQRMAEYSRVDQYPSLDRKAIAVTNTSMRSLPTAEPAFYDFSLAGEGFPFDYMQNSLVLAGTPLYATHISADRAWILVESRFTYGWVPARDIAWVDEGFIAIFKTGEYAAVTRDDVPLVNGTGDYRFTAHVGTILPILTKSPCAGEFALLIPVRTAEGDAVAQVTFLPDAFAAKAPLAATPDNFTRLINAMLGRPYGWGGMYEGRDCSAAIMDLMAPFGIYLPRNSSQQIKVGRSVSLEDMDGAAKKQALLTQGTPFLTMVRKPGHIMLYVGQHHDEPVIFHAVWGLKTRKGDQWGRKVIGRAVITTLEPGTELPDLARPGGVLLESVYRMSTLP